MTLFVVSMVVNVLVRLLTGTAVHHRPDLHWSDVLQAVTTSLILTAVMGRRLGS